MPDNNQIGPSPPYSVQTDPGTNQLIQSKKSSTKKTIVIILGILLLIGGTVTGIVFLNQQQGTKVAPAPVPPQVETTCLQVKAYDTQWNQLTSSELSGLEPGDVVRFAVAGITTSGSFDKAKFTINGSLRPEVSQKKTGTDEFYDEYPIPEDTTSFTVSAQVHHTALGWF